MSLRRHRRPEGTPRGPLTVNFRTPIPLLCGLLLLTGSILFSACTRPVCSGASAYGNLGPGINSPWDDYAPVLPDSILLYYTSNRLDPEHTGLHERVLEFHPASLYRTLRLSDEWDSPLRIDLVRKEDRDVEIGATTFPPAGNRQGVLAYTTICNLPENQLWKGECEIVMVRGVEGEGRISPVPGLNSEEWDAQPSATADGTRLYFASAREGGHGGSDIWYVDLGADGSWSRPQNAGPAVNTAGEELSPWVDPKTGRLYFAATTEQGDYDIYVLDPDRTERTPLPAPYNSTASEITPFIIGDSFYVASDRPGGCGGYDLYRFSR